MQVQKKSKAFFWLLLFPWRVILFFQSRALTGFWFCILKWLKSGDRSLCENPSFGSKGLDQWTRKRQPKSTGGRRKQTCNAMAPIQVVTNMMNLCPADLLPVRKNPLNMNSSVLWIPEHYRTISFPWILWQRLASCRLQCLSVQISSVSVGSLTIALGRLCWNWSGLYLAPIKEK